MTGIKEWQDYTAPVGGVAGSDTLLMLDVSDDTDNAAGTVRQPTAAALGLFLTGLVNVISAESADATGSADATTAFQNALTSLAAFGGTALAPAGTFKLTPVSTTVPALTVPSGVTLAGVGQGATTLLKNGNGPLIDFSGPGPISQTTAWNTHQGLRDLAINGNGKTGLLLRLYYLQFYTESNVYLYGNADVSVDMAQCYDSRVTNGLYLYGGSATASTISGAQAVTHLIRNSAAPATTLSSGISGTVTSLPVAALPAAMPAGIVQCWNASGQVQNFTTTGAVSGATSIPVTSAAVAHTFVSGNAVNGFGWSGDSTNALVMQGCHWETNLSGAIWITPGVNNTSQLNSVYINGSKCEQDAIGYSCPQIKVDPGTADIKIDGLYFYAGPFNSGYSTAVPGIYFHPDYGALNKVFMSNGGAATISTGIDAGTLSGFRVTCSDVFQFWSTSPTVAGFNGSAGQTFLTNFQVNGTVTTPFTGTYSLINDGNGNWAFAGAGVVGGITGFGPYVMYSQSTPGATGSAATLYADGNGMLSVVTPAGLASVLQQSQYSATSPVTVTAASITSLGSLPVDAGDPVAGARYRVTAHGTLGTASSAPVATVDLRWGGTTGTLITSLVTNTSAPALAASLSAVPVQIEGEIEFITSTTVKGWLKLTWRNSATATSAATVALASITTAVTVTTSSAESFSLDWTWSATGTGTTITIASSSFERVA